MDTVVKRRTMTLPWEAPHMAREPWHLHQWYANAETGGFCLLDHDIRQEVDRETQRRVWVRGDAPINRFKGQVPEFIDKDELERIYRTAATDDTTLMEAFIKLRGEEEFSQKWLDQALENASTYANPKYAANASAEPVQAPKKRGPGRPRKVSVEE